MKSQKNKAMKMLVFVIAGVTLFSACGERKKQGGTVQIRPTSDRGAIGAGGVGGLPNGGQATQSAYQDPLPNKGWGFIFSSGNQGDAWNMLKNLMMATFGGEIGAMRQSEFSEEGYLKADVQIKSGNGLVNLNQAFDQLVNTVGMQYALNPQGSLVLAINDNLTDQSGQYLSSISVAITPSAQGQVTPNSALFSQEDGIGANITFQDNVGWVNLAGYFTQSNNVIYYVGTISYDNGQNNYTNTPGLIMSGTIGVFRIEACRIFNCN